MRFPSTPSPSLWDEARARRRSPSLHPTCRRGKRATAYTKELLAARRRAQPGGQWGVFVATRLVTSQVNVNRFVPRRRGRRLGGVKWSSAAAVGVDRVADLCPVGTNSQRDGGVGDSTPSGVGDALGDDAGSSGRVVGRLEEAHGGRDNAGELFRPEFALLGQGRM